MAAGCIREASEQWEREYLSPYAVQSADTKGRVHSERECDIRTAFQRDRDRIIHSKAFRRLKHKTQVFISPEGDHYRTRLTHTLEVAQIARTMARALRLNEDLTEAIALGHDLGHTPFGHAGETALDQVFAGGFKHNEQSLRVVELLERRCAEYNGLNLTWEVRDGILTHTGPSEPSTLEGRLVRLADRIAYVNHDVDDAVRAGIISESELPGQAMDVLGRGSGHRIDLLVRDVIRESLDSDQVRMSRRAWDAMDCLRNYLFEHVYIGSEAKTEEAKAKAMVQELYRYFIAHTRELPPDLSGFIPEYGTERVVLDFVAGMTDRFAVKEYVRLFVPAAWERY